MNLSIPKGFSHSVLNVLALLAGLPASILLSLLPQSRRFRAAILLARIFVIPYRYLVYSRRAPAPLDGPREDLLRAFLRLMDRGQIRFDPIFTITDSDLVPRGAAMILTGHFLLTAAWTRATIESGQPIAVFTVDEQMRLIGSAQRADVIGGPAKLLAARSRLRAGWKVSIALDSTIENPDWIRIETPHVLRWVSDAPARLAERMGVPVLFVAARLDESWKIVVSVRRPSSTDSRIVMEEYQQFFVEHVGLMRR